MNDFEVGVNRVSPTTARQSVTDASVRRDLFGAKQVARVGDEDVNGLGCDRLATWLRRGESRLPT